MGEFAKSTSVPAEKTRAEIETVLKKYGAGSFAAGWNDAEAFVAFVASGRMIRFKIALPDPNAQEFTHVKAWQKRSETQAAALYEQAVRTIWRRLLLCIRAKLESVASKIETFDSAFQSHIVLPDGQTVGEWLKPQIEAAYASKEMPKRLMLGPAAP